MMLDFWAKTSGTWVNVLTVLVGTTLGLLLERRLPVKMQKIITQGIGLLTLWLGFEMADRLLEVEVGRANGVILGLLVTIIGGILGEWWQLEERLSAIGDGLKKRFRGKGRFTEGFVAASILFCVGPMTLIGSLNNGLTGDAALLNVKATMDGIVSVALAGSYGIGVGFSTVIIAIYQGGISLGAGVLAGIIGDPTVDPGILLATGVGGLTIVATGLNLLEVTRIRVASFLPGLAIAPIACWVANFLR
ncbi:MAG: DUF554 domain-containing protein [Cyanobacteriota bacterium]|nr:DUF554 domain-containing protein [Cyanobacteriota bacterium]